MNDILEMQLRTMLTLQNDINSKIDPDWMERGRPWRRAIWVECGEMMDHAGYKWWKSNLADTSQVQLELVDIWHFALSSYYEAARRPTELGPVFVKHLDNSIPPPQPELLRLCENFARAVLTKPGFPLDLFIGLMNATSLTFDSLFVQYIGKNVLNVFRQDYGYKEGTYIKNWFGDEDNTVLTRIVELLDPNAPDFAECVRQGLVSEYQKVLEACDK